MADLWWGVIALFVGTLAAPATAAESARTHPTTLVLKRFSGPNGAAPQGALVLGATGALFGTAANGGDFDSGLVFELAPPASGKTGWTVTHLYDFCATIRCIGGSLPLAGLTPNGAGGFFGTTSAGGRHGSGTVFWLRPPTAGSTRWSLTAIHDFCAETSCADGESPQAPVLLGDNRVLYGTTYTGGAHSYGTVFALTPPAAGQTRWKYEVIHDFDFHDGAGPLGNLTLGSAGKLYGTASEAGAHGAGAAFELRPPAAGSRNWSFRVVYQFCAKPNCADGANPYSGLLRAKDGRLYGTTQTGGLCTAPIGGSECWGVVYALIPPGYGTLRVVHSFAFSDGAAPVGGLVQDTVGALYGTTSLDGAFGSGTVFKLEPIHRGWAETVLHDFTGPDGAQPVTTPTLGAGGVVYGTTKYGGSESNFGVVFKTTP